MLVRCFHSFVSVHSLDLTSVSALSLICSLDGKILHFFLFPCSEKELIPPSVYADKLELGQAGWRALVARDAGRLGAPAEPRTLTELSLRRSWVVLVASLGSWSC